MQLFSSLSVSLLRTRAVLSRLLRSQCRFSSLGCVPLLSSSRLPPYSYSSITTSLARSPQIPEGLPATVTLLLSIAAQRMAKENVLVKDLQGVETLGALTLLATDKTGTLTRNEMTVTNLWSGDSMVSAFQSNNDASDTEVFRPDAPGMREMVAIACLNSRVKFDRADVPFERRVILGDATETGLAKFAAKFADTQGAGKEGSGDGYGYDRVVKAHAKVFEIPFNSTNKWALAVVRPCPLFLVLFLRYPFLWSFVVLRECRPVRFWPVIFPSCESESSEERCFYPYPNPDSRRTLVLRGLLRARLMII